MTEQPSTLAAALAAVQAKLPTIKRSETATVATRSGGSYQYSYADLAAVSRVVLPLLAEAGLCWICKPMLNADQKFVLAFSIIHAVSGERESGEYPLNPGGTPQERGSEITYARRYCLTSMVGVAPEDDDDGAIASQRPAVARGTRKAVAAKRAEEEPNPERRKRRLFVLYGEEGPEERDARLDDLSKILGRPIKSSNELTPDDVEAVITVLEQRQRDRKRNEAGHG